MKKHLPLILSITAGLLSAVLFLLTVYDFLGLTPHNDTAEIVLEEDTSLWSAAWQLKEKGIVSHPEALWVFGLITKCDVKGGTAVFSQNMDYLEICSVLKGRGRV